MSATGIRFFHSFELPGETIKGIRPLSTLSSEADFAFKHGVAGKSVLDIGAWDGHFSFDAERRGARSVLATDHFCWSGPGWGTKAGFDYVHAKKNSSVKSFDVDVFNLDPAKLGTFNLVLFLGVLYHLKDPFGGLEKAAAMSNDQILVETASDMQQTTEPVMRYYLGGELNGDKTNFWAPNLPCLVNMLKELGFVRFDTKVANPNAKQSRIAVHAWRN